MSIDYEGDFKFDEFERKLAAAIPVAALVGADYLLDKGNERAPVLVDLKRANKKRRAHPGELRDSGKTRNVGNDAEFGWYVYWAKWQHEREDFNHVVGEWKWAERTAVEDGEEALRKSTAKLSEELRA